jgi:hypothetical protein
MDANGLELFNLLFSCGEGCVGSGNFGMDFQDGCSLVRLQETSTECTGNRSYLAGVVILTRQ